jgi:SSS family solute:Na+ symporter
MHWIDWLIVAVPWAAIFGLALYTRRYVRGVADFMAGGRNAGRYLLATARSEMGAGAVVLVATFEMIARSGFTLNWWATITVPVGLLVATTGFVIYRYRETQALTLAQFFEMRYSKRFRLATGLLGFVAGIANFGIIPVIEARCVMYFFGLPTTLAVAGFSVPTFIPLMALFLAITVTFTLCGGQITVMLVDCLEGMLSQLGYLVIIAALLWMFPWSKISEALLQRPAGASFVNPFDSFGTRDFNLWYVLMSVAVSIYGTMAWQNAHAFNSSATTPHESRMGGILGRWRDFARGLMVALLAICAITFLNHPDFSALAAAARAETARIPELQIQKQMEIPIAISRMLPPGIKGLLIMILLMGMTGGNSMHLHSWASIFVQDVLVPRRRTPYSPAQHLRLLRGAVIGVALFAFVFGSLFRQTEYVVMWFQVTTAIFVGGAGAAILGGLYWRRGTTAGAWAALLVGSGLATGGILLRQAYPAFPLNGMQISFGATLLAVAVYVAVSWLTCRTPFDMDRLLHRGRYAETPPSAISAPPVRRNLLSRIIGADADFSRGDLWVTQGIFWWSMTWFFVFVVGSVWNLIQPWPTRVWVTYWHVTGIVLPLVLSVVTTVWFTIGGARDIRSFFRRLRAETINTEDDGTVPDRGRP